MSPKDNNGHVTYKVFLSTIVSVILLMGAVGSFAWAQHVRNPHDGVITEPVMFEYAKRIEDKFNFIQRRLDSIDKKLEK